MTIEERASQIIKDTKPIISEYQIKDMLIEIATDQQRIDIEKAWKWITVACSKYPITKEELPILEQSFYKVMEE